MQGLRADVCDSLSHHRVHVGLQPEFCRIYQDRLAVQAQFKGFV
jgi:hypothetical protein